MQWHAHEMTFGYAIAVIAGFLLTAIKNWTGVQTLHGFPLFLLVCLWLGARILLGLGYILPASVVDLIFLLMLLFAVVYPICQSKQWKHFLIVIVITLFFIANLVFYLGALGQIEKGVETGVYAGLYLVIGLILIMARRVVPFFIEKGIDQTVKIPMSKLNDSISFTLFVVFFVLILLNSHQIILAYVALSLFLINTMRLITWHHSGIWRIPLLWSLYLAVGFICLGFLLVGLTSFMGISKYLAIHAFAYGGIGLITLGMMSRVSLGHTGRDVSKPPVMANIAFGVLILGAAIRVILPLFFPGFYSIWIASSQVLWILTFVIFVFLFIPVLVRD